MDLQIRFWDIDAAIVRTRYYDSKFVLRPNADNLFVALQSVLTKLPNDRMVQLSMDGP